MVLPEPSIHINTVFKKATHSGGGHCFSFEVWEIIESDIGPVIIHLVIGLMPTNHYQYIHKNTAPELLNSIHNGIFKATTPLTYIHIFVYTYTCIHIHTYQSGVAF